MSVTLIQFRWLSLEVVEPASNASTATGITLLGSSDSEPDSLYPIWVAVVLPDTKSSVAWIISLMPRRARQDKASQCVYSPDTEDRHDNDGKSRPASHNCNQARHDQCDLYAAFQGGNVYEGRTPLIMGFRISESTFEAPMRLGFNYMHSAVSVMHLRNLDSRRSSTIRADDTESDLMVSAWE